jgi:hypothetical protein
VNRALKCEVEKMHAIAHPISSEMQYDIIHASESANVGMSAENTTALEGDSHNAKRYNK